MKPEGGGPAAPPTVLRKVNTSSLSSPGTDSDSLWRAVGTAEGPSLMLRFVDVRNLAKWHIVARIVWQTEDKSALE